MRSCKLDQTAFGEPAYPGIESKAAHLLYFTIKNHPFSDGNKRIGSFLFVDFLKAAMAGCSVTASRSSMTSVSPHWRCSWPNPTPRTRRCSSALS